MMAARTRGKIEVSGKATSWLRDGALDGRPVLILAHGAGAPYTHPFMETTALGLVELGLTVVRFHFPYMEQMVVEERRRPPSGKALLLDTWEAMLRLVSEWPECGPITMAGKSMGGRMASMLLAEGRAPGAVGAVYLGYPLHPPGKPEKLRADHLGDVPVPQLFVSGTKDNLCRLDLLEPVLKSLGKAAALHVVEGGDHSLALSRKDPLAGFDDWLAVVASFAKSPSVP